MAGWTSWVRAQRWVGWVELKVEVGAPQDEKVIPCGGEGYSEWLFSSIKIKGIIGWGEMRCARMMVVMNGICGRCSMRWACHLQSEVGTGGLATTTRGKNEASVGTTLRVADGLDEKMISDGPAELGAMNVRWGMNVCCLFATKSGGWQDLRRESRLRKSRQILKGCRTKVTVVLTTCGDRQLPIPA